MDYSTILTLRLQFDPGDLPVVDPNAGQNTAQPAIGVGLIAFGDLAGSESLSSTCGRDDTPAQITARVMGAILMNPTVRRLTLLAGKSPITSKLSLIGR